MKYKRYHIKKGRHYSNRAHLGLTLSNDHIVTAYFDKNCLYQIEGEDSHDINKLFGFSTAWHHHVQSIRLGWRCLDGKGIEILTYPHDAEVEESKERFINFEGIFLLDQVEPKQRFECQIFNHRDEFTFYYRSGEYENMVNIPKLSYHFTFIHYYLYPYFGGNKRAPHDMDIYMKYT